FVLEKFLFWRHCHKEHCEVHTFTYLNLIGDGLHNFIDGAIIAASFLVDFSLGISTTLAVIFHEIPQEIGDFCILIYGGWERKKALIFNFISALMAVIGALAVYFFSNQISDLIPILLSFAAGGFIYIAASDLIPELHKEPNLKKSLVSFSFFLLGIVFMFLLKFLFEH
nr:ZIP family metal transporter [Nanoarchaeota archaeon]